MTTRQDLAYVQAGVANLKDYLLSDQLFWPLGAGAGLSSLPQLTLGGLALARARLEASGEGGQLQPWLARLESLRSRWHSAWQAKAGWEFRSRLNQWRHYLEDYRRNPEGQAAFFPEEVKNRTRLELLVLDIPAQSEAERELLAGLDGQLRSVWIAGDFVWEPELAQGFPQERFWFLYGHPKE